jgi:hypothetical protein
MKIRDDIITIMDQIKKYHDVPSYTTFEDHLRPSLSMLDESVEKCFPSILLDEDGPSLNSVFIITNNYLLEVHMNEERLAFDFLKLKSISNYRFDFWDESISGANQSIISFQMATITLMHTENFSSSIYYAGSNRSEWVNSVLEAIPMTLLL